jgi:hypothetical protein
VVFKGKEQHEGRQLDYKQPKTTQKKINTEVKCVPVGNDFIWNLGQNKNECKKAESKKMETRTKAKDVSIK